MPRELRPSGKNVSRASWGAKCCARLIGPPVWRGLPGFPGLFATAVMPSVTDKAATAISTSPELGTLPVGSVGDAAVLDVLQGEFTVVDAAGNQVQSG
jgi:hypothetical protein